MDAWKSFKITKTPLMKKEIACGDCEFKTLCLWCPGFAYLETGSSERKIDYLCQTIKALKENDEKRKENTKAKIKY